MSHRGMPALLATGLMVGLAACAQAPQAGVLAPVSPGRTAGAISPSGGAGQGPSPGGSAGAGLTVAPSGSGARSVAALGRVAAPSPPRGASERAAAGRATVAAYLAAVVTMVRTGDPADFLAVTTPGCECRGLRSTTDRLATAGGVPEFDVRLRSVREVASSALVASVLRVDLVIPHHVEPAAGGRPRTPVAARRFVKEFYVVFRGGQSRVDTILGVSQGPA